ncbi:MAG: glycosyltransferase family 39 protein [Deltaproteobacteria bacterium]|nr:MAG: glycosyltransferase family 39 protein [Deltaproteobacteria bacterium]
MCAVIPIYLLVRDMSGSSYSSLIAALVTMSSWELIYHARWIAPDAILVFFISSALWAQHKLIQSSHQKIFFWTVIASIGSALCIATKYPAGLILIPLFISILIANRKEYGSELLKLLVTSTFVTIITFCLTTPGSVLEPVRFFQDIHYEMQHYSLGHGGYTIESGLSHLSKSLIYVVCALLSKNAIFALLLFVFFTLGVRRLFKESFEKSLWILSMPIFYLLYMSFQHVMIVRNYLLLIPFMSVVISVGFLHVVRSRFRIIRWGSGTAMAVIIFYNFFQISKSSLDIFQPNPLPRYLSVSEYVQSHPQSKFFISTVLNQEIMNNKSGVLTNHVIDKKNADYIIFSSREVSPWPLWIANKLGRYKTVWSRFEEVNWDYYPSWGGYDRIISVSTQDKDLEALRESIW